MIELWILAGCVLILFWLVVYLFRTTPTAAHVDRDLDKVYAWAAGRMSQIDKDVATVDTQVSNAIKYAHERSEESKGYNRATRGRIKDERRYLDALMAHQGLEFVTVTDEDDGSETVTVRKADPSRPAIVSTSTGTAGVFITGNTITGTDAKKGTTKPATRKGPSRGKAKGGRRA